VSYILIYPLFDPPFIIDIIVTITTCYFLQNMYVRFQMLNDVWKCLPVGLVPVSGQWTHNEIVNIIENTRLLHSELCELLRMFTQGYGLTLVSFFTSNFINMLLSFNFCFIPGASASSSTTKSVWSQIIPLALQIQTVTCLMSIAIFVSIINDKVTNCIIYLAHCHFFIKYTLRLFIL